MNKITLELTTTWQFAHVSPYQSTVSELKIVRVHFITSFLLIRYFLYLNFKCYPKNFLYPPSSLIPYPPTPNSLPWHSSVLGHIKFARPRGLSSHLVSLYLSLVQSYWNQSMVLKFIKNFPTVCIMKAESHFCIATYSLVIMQLN